MNRFLELLLNGLRNVIVPKITGKPVNPPLVYVNDRNLVNDMIKSKLLSRESCMIARYGSVELSAAVNYIDVQGADHSYMKYIKGEVGAWWWQEHYLEKLKTNAGFFPINKENVERYAKLLIEDSKLVDILGSMAPLEHRMDEYLGDCPRVRLRYLEPDFFTTDVSETWLQVLRGKRVLVIHPYADTIRKQYENRTKLFKDPEFLPEFELLTIKAVQSLGGICEYKTWFDALHHMEEEMDSLDYEFAIIGCGAYGFNLAAHAKRTGHKAIHLGGVTQLLFGIIGKRWEEREDFRQLINEYWVRPSDSEKPMGANKVEGGCYW